MFGIVGGWLVENGLSFFVESHSPHPFALIPPLYLRCTSVPPPSYLRVAGGGRTEVERRYNGGISAKGWTTRLLRNTHRGLLLIPVRVQPEINSASKARTCPSPVLRTPSPHPMGREGEGRVRLILKATWNKRRRVRESLGLGRSANFSRLNDYPDHGPGIVPIPPHKCEISRLKSALRQGLANAPPKSSCKNNFQTLGVILTLWPASTLRA